MSVETAIAIRDRLSYDLWNQVTPRMRAHVEADVRQQVLGQLKTRHVTNICILIMQRAYEKSNAM